MTAPSKMVMRGADDRTTNVQTCVRVPASSVPIPPVLRGRRATPYAWHDQRLGGESPLWRLMAPTTSRRQLLRREAGGKEARGEIATLGTHGAPACWSGAVRCACEAGRPGRASGLRRSPMSIKGPLRRRGGCARKAVGLIQGDLHGCLRMPIHARACSLGGARRRCSQGRRSPWRSQQRPKYRRDR
jgi:hypothetical protein